MRWTGIALVVLAAAGIVLAVVWPRVSGTRAEFAGPAEAVLRKLAPGPNAPDLREVAGEVYDQAAPTFRETLIRDRFIDRMVQLNVTLGKLRTVLAVVAEEKFKSRAGDVVRVNLNLEFERARTSGSVAYVKRDDAFRLLGIEVTIPESRLAFSSSVVAEYSTIDTPDVVLEKLSAVLGAIQDGKSNQVYREAAPQFRDVTAEQFASHNAEQKAALGNYRRVLAAINTGMSMDQRRLRLYALVEYDKARAPVTMELERGPDLRKNKLEDFLLLSLRIEVPDPFVPLKTPQELRPVAR